MKPYWSHDDRIKPVELTRGHSCAVVYTVSRGLLRSCTIANTIIHGHGIRVSFLKVIYSNGPSVTRIRPRLARLYVRFTRMANRISRVFCVRQA